MGVKVTFNATDHLIEVTTAPVNGLVTLDFGVDVYSDGKEDWRTTDALARHTFPIRAVGGDPLPGAQVLDSTFFILAPWRILPYDADHELILNGNVYREDGAALVAGRAGRSITSRITSTFSAGASSSGGGSSADDVWSHAKALTVGKFLGLK